MLKCLTDLSCLNVLLTRISIFFQGVYLAPSSRASRRPRKQRQKVRNPHSSRPVLSDKHEEMDIDRTFVSSTTDSQEPESLETTQTQIDRINIGIHGLGV